MRLPHRAARSAAPGACTGEPLECSKYLPGSCTTQPNCEASASGACNNQRTSGLPARANVSNEYACVSTLGCTWEDPDGTKHAAEYGTWHCHALCIAHGQPTGYCSADTETPCGMFNATAPTPESNNVRHPKNAKGACELRKGCSWKPVVP